MLPKRWLNITLISMIAIFVNGFVSFAEQTAAGKFNYTEQDGVVTIIQYKGSATTIDLGEEFPEAEEIVLGNDSFRSSSIIKVTIPKNVSSIGANAFQDCKSLQTVTFEDRTTENLVFGDYAFYGCSNLLSLDIPDTVIAIPARFCDFCSALASVNLPDSCQSIGEYAFANCKALKSITIPAGCNSISKKAFLECELLAAVSFEERENTEIEFVMGEGVFSYCDALSVIEIPQNCKTIPAEAFNSCSSLTTIILPDTCESIGAMAFYACTALNQMNNEKSGNLILPKNCKTIGSEAFEGCTSIKNVCIPLVCTSMGEETFWKCTNLNVVTFENPNTVIGTNAFSASNEAKNLVIYCDGAGSVTIYATTYNIAFTTSLLSITITKLPMKTNYFYEQNGKLDISDMKIVAEYQKEDGTEQEEVNPEDCIFSAFESDKVGEQTITVSYGNKQADFLVRVYYNIENAIVEIDNAVYTGVRVEPYLTVNGKETGSKLIENKDYTLSCSNNINAGTATAKLSGIGDYRGENTISFKILPKTISEGNTIVSVDDMEYTGSQLKPVPMVVCGIEPLLMDEDYVVTYGTNTNVGKGFVIIEGIGNYNGSIKKWFNIHEVSGTGSNENSGTATGGTEGGGTTSGDTGKIESGGAGDNTIIETASIEKPQKGKTYVYKNMYYKVTSASTVTFMKPVSKKVKKITIPSKVTILGKSFKVTKINKKACHGCSKVTSMSVGNYVTVIGDEAFAKCSKLKTVTLGKGLKTIGRKVFYQDKTLKEIIIMSTKLTSVGKGTLKGVKKVKIGAPKKKVGAYTKLFKNAK